MVSDPNPFLMVLILQQAAYSFVTLIVIKINNSHSSTIKVVVVYLTSVCFK